jgi:hypothetical protein
MAISKAQATLNWHEDRCESATEVKDVIIPTFAMSKRTERNGLQALKDHKQGKTTLVNDIDEFIDSL